MTPSCVSYTRDSCRICGGLCLQVGATSWPTVACPGQVCVVVRTDKYNLRPTIPGIQFGTWQVVQVPPYRGLYHCTILCLLTCTILYRSVPPRYKPINIWLSLVQGGTNWYNRVSCKWYKGWYNAVRFVPLCEVLGRLQPHHKGVGNTHRKPILVLSFTTQSRDLAH